ncbi:response regulator [Nitrospira sp. Kam-Ns4a]
MQDGHSEGPVPDRSVVPLGKWGRILIADDNEPVRELLSECLRREGYLCDGVGTAAEAARALTAHAYDLLITDINMPDSTTLAYLQDCQRGAVRVPVIVITGYPSVMTAIEAVRLSVVDYLVKPVDPELLVASVNRAIGKGSLLRALRKVREEIHTWGAAMDRLEASLLDDGGLWTGAASASRIDHLRTQTMYLLGQITESLRAALETTRKEGLGHPSVDLCQAVGCLKGTRYEGALRRTVAVLARTTSALPSQELVELQQALDTILQREAGA